MRELREYILNEVSKETAKRASSKAAKDIVRLTDEFAQSKFKDMNILAQLQKRARQVDVFNDYIETVNQASLDACAGELKKVINKWKAGKQLSNGSTFEPMFILSSYPTWESSEKVGRWGRSEKVDKDKRVQAPVFEFLTVIGLNSDYSKEIKTIKKTGQDASNLENMVAEYDAINEELKSDLTAISGITYDGDYANRKSSRNPYNTIVMTFQIDSKLINAEELASKLKGWETKDRDRQMTGKGMGEIYYATYVTKKKELYAQ